MKKLYFIIIPVVICSLLCASSLLTRLNSYKTYTVANTPSDVTPTIIIDAGHGGFDGGASTDDGYAEKHINLNISLHLRDLLVMSGYNVVMTRTEDISLEDEGLDTVRERKRSDIYNRMKIMEETDNAIFVSIHQNHYSSERYWGLQVFYSGNFSEYSQPMAEAIQETVSELLQPDNDRQIKECGTSVYLLYNAKKPAILVECGFLSNHKEAELLKTEEYQKTISCCIYMGLLEYLSGGQRNG